MTMAAVDRTPLSEPLLTADEVAALLRVPRSTVYELTRSRRLPHIANRITLRTQSWFRREVRCATTA
jgi:excisionase family DNA binding protein